MKKRLRFTLLSLIIMIMIPGFSCMAAPASEEYIPLSQENHIPSGEITYSTQGIPYTLYAYISDAWYADFMRRDTVCIGVYLDSKGWQGFNFTYFGSDAKEIAELSQGKVYEISCHIPTGKVLYEEEIVAEGTIITNAVQSDDSYILEAFHQIYRSYNFTDDTFVIEYKLQGTEYDTEFADFLANRAALLGGDTDIAFIEPPTEEDLAEIIEEQDVTIEITEPIVAPTPVITEITNVTEEVIPEEPEVIEENKIDIKVWLIGGLSLLALFFISLKFATKKEQ